MRPESPTSPRRLRARDRWQKCLELRRSGATFAQIATEVGYSSPRRAQEAVQKLLREMVEPASDEIRAFEISRLDRLLLAHWANALKPSPCPRCRGGGSIAVGGPKERSCPACHGLGITDFQIKSTDIVIKILDRLHRMKGLEKIESEGLAQAGDLVLRILRTETWRNDVTVESGTTVEAIEISERGTPQEQPIERLASWRTGGNGNGNGSNGGSRDATEGGDHE